MRRSNCSVRRSSRPAGSTIRSCFPMPGTGWDPRFCCGSRRRKRRRLCSRPIDRSSITCRAWPGPIQNWAAAAGTGRPALGVGAAGRLGAGIERQSRADSPVDLLSRQGPAEALGREARAGARRFPAGFGAGPELSSGGARRRDSSEHEGCCRSLRILYRHRNPPLFRYRPLRPGAEPSRLWRRIAPGAWPSVWASGGNSGAA